MKFGKRVAECAYAPDMLPQNRKEVFWDVVKIHWRKLFGMGIIMFLFSLPLYLILWIGDSQLLHLQEIASGLTQAQLQEQYYTLAIAKCIHCAASVPFWGLLGVGISGLLRVIRQFAWEENVHLFTDFFRGIRENWKHTVLVFLIIGTVSGVCTATYNMIPYGSEFLGLIVLLQIGVTLAVVLPVCGIYLAMIPVYSNSVKQYVAISLAIYLKSLFRTLGACLGCALIVVPVLVPLMLFHIAGPLVTSLLIPFVLLIWFLYCSSQFDLHINPQYYPELMNRGVLGKQIQSN